MSYAAHRKDFAPPITELEPRDTNPPTRVGFWRRLFKGREQVAAEPYGSSNCWLH
jgi:hypothetical protein